MTMITTRSSLQTPKQTSGWKLYKVSIFKIFSPVMFEKRLRSELPTMISEFLRKRSVKEITMELNTSRLMIKGT